ncbi:uncharacterized protein LOC18438397 [Amborella trichopoda]|uniref:Armadillo-like repeats domain-containing protein n=1 Tax=Amborella trichopoda TaxID=13333 RepID=W1PSK3_AMBTC|nr:uncharacterized protein LOC18438397 [Amborella trichopoda]ERN10225.1 hypothetical protein AMTR_s00171p00052720 [Amborella trichopoda]|eukprot:XP_006848644.1 uncharacterized protein LOC18438397 [Amborella trichopoda]
MASSASSSLRLHSWGTLNPSALPKGIPLLSPSPISLFSSPQKRAPLPVLRAQRKGEQGPVETSEKKEAKSAKEVEEEEEEVEEEVPWIEEKAADLVEFTGTVTQAIPGPRVGQSSLPWLLAVPLAYVGLSFVVAVFKTLRKLNSPKAKRRRLVNKNAMLCKSIDDVLQMGRDELQHSTLEGLMQKTGFGMEEILRKYIRYALNEKPFNPDVVMDLIHIRKVTMLDDAQVAEVLNEISRRIVQEKGPVVMDTSGFTEKGFRRKLAVQALFGKLFYLSELQEFCSREGSLILKEIFGVTDEDADIVRIHTLSDSGDFDSLQKMAGLSDSEDDSSSSPKDDSSSSPDS